MGTTLRELLDMAGGIRDGHELKFWTPGGSSTPMFTAEHLDVPLDFDSVAAAGDSSLASVSDRTTYTRTWSVPGGERGQTFWYRAAYTEGGVRYASPSRSFVSPLGPSVAFLEVTLVHNAYDNDITASVVVGDPQALARP